MNPRKTEENQKNIEENIKKYSKLSQEELFKEFNTSYNGLSIVEIDDRIEEYGENIIDIKNNNTILNRLKEAFINPFNIVLILVAIITFKQILQLQNRKIMQHLY